MLFALVRLICSATFSIMKPFTKLMKDRWCAYRSPFRASQLYALAMVEDEVGSQPVVYRLEILPRKLIHRNFLSLC